MTENNINHSFQTSECILNIGPALLSSQISMPHTHADKTGQIGNRRYTYSDLTQLIPLVLPILNQNGLVVIQSPSYGGDGRTLNLTTMIIHAQSGEWIRDTASMPLADYDPQGFGSAVTYLRRYALEAIFELVDEDDDGAKATPRTQTKQTNEKFTTTATPSSKDITKEEYEEKYRILEVVDVLIKGLKPAQKDFVRTQMLNIDKTDDPEKLSLSALKELHDHLLTYQKPNTHKPEQVDK